ncbi:hypothetical protein DCS_06627 [Drechmeria coniospora]|uniref:Uncharacterized protein n=1 Tax=Drechmeria coniospora TaxID=98403 RepID=A0A151GC31_DRECN|nr:hypothetical protein DCS_06627 [Drechmeria coniospora]KYK54667.1 hypothetical protein DCS_06627 [Drechmeria coniospora]
MVGAPTYTDQEISFVLEKVLGKATNLAIRNGFERRFGRPLSASQLRYLKGKYGKDPRFNSPLVNNAAGSSSAISAVAPVFSTSLTPRRQSHVPEFNVASTATPPTIPPLLQSRREPIGCEVPLKAERAAKRRRDHEDVPLLPDERQPTSKRRLEDDEARASMCQPDEVVALLEETERATKRRRGIREGWPLDDERVIKRHRIVDETEYRLPASTLGQRQPGPGAASDASFVSHIDVASPLSSTESPDRPSSTTGLDQFFSVTHRLHLPTSAPFQASSSNCELRQTTTRNCEHLVEPSPSIFTAEETARSQATQTSPDVELGVGQAHATFQSSSGATWQNQHGISVDEFSGTDSLFGDTPEHPSSRDALS